MQIINPGGGGGSFSPYDLWRHPWGGIASNGTQVANFWSWGSRSEQGVTHGYATRSGGVDADGRFSQLNTSTTIGDDARVYFNGNLVQLQELPHLIHKFKLVQTDDIKMMVGLASNIFTWSGADDPATSHLILEYNSDTDSNYHWVTRDGTTQNRIDTGVSADTLAHLVEFIPISATSQKAILYAADGITVLSTITLTLNLPAPTTDLYWGMACYNKVAAVKSVKLYHMTEGVLTDG